MNRVLGITQTIVQYIIEYIREKSDNILEHNKGLLNLHFVDHNEARHECENICRRILHLIRMLEILHVSTINY